MDQLFIKSETAAFICHNKYIMHVPLAGGPREDLGHVGGFSIPPDHGQSLGFSVKASAHDLTPVSSRILKE